MSEVLTKPSNGVSYGYRHEVTSDDVSDGEVVINFQVSLPLAASVMITRSGAVDGADAVITYPANGQISIADGSTYTLTAGDIISVVANYTRGDV